LITLRDLYHNELLEKLLDDYWTLERLLQPGFINKSDNFVRTHGLAYKIEHNV